MPITALHQFPRGFLWGCSSSAHQVEGQNINDWWRRTDQHQKAGRACDWWAGRYLEDFDRAAEMNNNAQRISIEWSRIEPEPGVWDDWALDRYREMIKALIARSMTPMITLNYLTNPLWIEDQEGWEGDDTPVYFERFVNKVVTALSDLCSLWCTINEPTLLHVAGHVRAYHAIKAIQPQSQVGCTLRGGFRRGTIRRVPPINIPQDTLDWVGLQYHAQPNSETDTLSQDIQQVWRWLKKPIYITERGIADEDDSRRPRYLVESVRSMWSSVNFNFPVRGFFFYSLLDTFEWANGYDPHFRFGLYQTNFETQERIAKRSALLYRDICAQNGLSAETVDQYTPQLLSSLFPGDPGQNNVKLNPNKKPVMG